MGAWGPAADVPVVGLVFPHAASEVTPIVTAAVIAGSLMVRASREPAVRVARYNGTLEKLFRNLNAARCPRVSALSAMPISCTVPFCTLRTPRLDPLGARYQ